MKRMIHFALFAAIFLTALVIAVPKAQAHGCTMRDAAGPYGFTLLGTVILPSGPVPIAAVGKTTLDASGNVSGVESRSVGGGFADETFSGTYSVNSDCTGTATIQFYESGQLVRTSVLSLVFDNDQCEIRMVQKSLQLPNGAFLPVVVTVEAKRTFTPEK